MRNLAALSDNLDVTIIIVSYNTREMTNKCIHSILKQTSSIRYEVIVVDNASTDGSAEAIRTNFPNIKAHCFGGESRIRAREQSRCDARSGASATLAQPGYRHFESCDRQICTSLLLRVPNAAFGAVVPCLPTAR